MKWDLVKTDNKQKGLIKLDARTLLFLILISNLAIFFMPEVYGEIVMMILILLLAILCGAVRTSLKIGIAYFVILISDYFITNAFSDSWLIYVVIGMRYMRKVLPCTILGGVLISTIRVGELMLSLRKIHIPKSITIPFTVLLRYFPSIGEDRNAIKKAMAVRGLNGSFLKHPFKSIENIYVPIMMSAARRADELSSAAVTRGIENPKERTTLIDVRLHCVDYVSMVLGVFVVLFCLGGLQV